MRKPKTPLLALVAFAASPRGRKLLDEVRRKVDTPENRERAKGYANQGMARIRQLQERRRPA